MSKIVERFDGLFCGFVASDDGKLRAHFIVENIHFFVPLFDADTTDDYVKEFRRDMSKAIRDWRAMNPEEVET
jgi:hypothetical protein